MEAIFKTDQEGMYDFLKDIFLGLDLFNLISFDEVDLVHDLNGIELAVVLLLCENDLPKGSSP